MGLLTSGAFATALLGILLIYYSVTSLEASEEEDFASNEVYQLSYDYSRLYKTSNFIDKAWEYYC